MADFKLTGGCFCGGVRYTVNEAALRHGAGVEQETTEPSEAYARFAEDRPTACPPEFPPA